MLSTWVSKSIICYYLFFWVFFYSFSEREEWWAGKQVRQKASGDKSQASSIAEVRQSALSQDGGPGDSEGTRAKHSGSGSRLYGGSQTGRGGAGAWRNGLCCCCCRCLWVAGSRAGGRAVSQCRSWRCRRWWSTPWCCSVWWITSTGERAARGGHTAQGCWVTGAPGIRRRVGGGRPWRAPHGGAPSALTASHPRRGPHSQAWSACWMTGIWTEHATRLSRAFHQSVLVS